MTEDTSHDRLWIYVRNWERFQGRRASTGQPWFAVYTDLFDDPDFLALGAPDRCLFFGILCDTKRLGNGRVSGNLAALRSRHNVRRASITSLVQAGFVVLSGTRGEPTVHQRGALQDKTEEETPQVSSSSVVWGKGVPPTALGAGDTPPNGKPRPPSAEEWTEELETKWRNDLAAWAETEGHL